MTPTEHVAPSPATAAPPEDLGSAPPAVRVTPLSHTRNLVAPETAELNRTDGRGGYTFNALIPDAYSGRVFIVAALRLGDHAHVEISSGRATGEPHQTLNYGKAGNIILRWPEWQLLRSILEPHECVRIAEVERPTVGQLRFHGAEGPPALERTT